MQNIATRHSSRGADFWTGHHQGWQESGLSKVDYFNEFGLSKTAGYYWFRKFEKKDQGRENIIVPTNYTVINNATRNCQSIKLTIKNRFQIEISDDFQAHVLTKVVKTLEDIP